MNGTLTRQARSRFGLAAVGLITVLAVGACGGTGGSKSDSGSEQNAAAPAQRLTEQDSSSGAKTGTAVKFPVRAVEERSLIYKGELTVRASNVDEAAAKASTIATGAGGVVAGDNRKDGSGGDQSTADLTIRVPSAAFTSTVGKLSDLGKELNRGINVEDVTEAAVDLDTRIASQTASVNRTRALLARAQQITDIVTIEQELARREADLGSLQARKRSLADQVTLSTITLHLIGPTASAPADEDEKRTFFTGLAGGWNAFTATVNGLLIVFGALLPFMIAFGIPAAVLIWALRRRKQRPVGPPPGPLGPPAPAAEG